MTCRLCFLPQAYLITFNAFRSMVSATKIRNTIPLISCCVKMNKVQNKMKRLYCFLSRVSFFHEKPRDG